MTRGNGAMTKKVTNDTNCILSSDIDEIMELEKSCFEHPWSRTFFEDEIKDPDSTCLKVTEGKKIIAYIVLKQFVDEIHIMNLATHPDHRKKGIAKKLLNNAISDLNSGKLLLLEVRNSNEAAKKLYESEGFKELYKRKAYYPNGEDALVMVKKMDMVRDYDGILIRTEKLSKDIVSMWLKVDGLDFEAGQFLMLEVPGFPLRRPFVIAEKDGSNIRIIFKLRGRGTASLNNLHMNMELKILAPLGKPFTLPNKNITPLLVGGGMGIVTLMPLAKELSKGSKVIALLGADTSDSMILTEEMKKYSDIVTCTDDGSCGERCNVVELTQKYIDKNKGNYCIYACGPTPMLKNIAKLAKKRSIKCYVSLEERMGCGVGACLCCAVKTENGVQRVCKDGPMFDSSEIKWEEK